MTKAPGYPSACWELRKKRCHLVPRPSLILHVVGNSLMTLQ